MSNFAQKFKNMWNPPEDEFDYEETTETTTAEDTSSGDTVSDNYTSSTSSSYHDVSSHSYEPERRSNVVNFSNSAELKVVLFKPMDYREDTRAIADELVRANTVVLNLEVTPKDVARRVLDFLGGVAYAKNGKVKRVSTNTYIITPANVSLTGDDMMDEAETEEAYI